MYIVSVLIYSCNSQLPVNAEEEHIKTRNNNEKFNNYFTMYIFHIAVFISPSLASATNIFTYVQNQHSITPHTDLATFLAKLSLVTKYAAF
jgi:UDP-N-acetylglucosamine pyrophosphorylase